jgi:hypothetical protein
MNAPTKSEADVIKAGLQTFLDVIAERDQLRNENEMLRSEVELKRGLIAEAGRQLETTKADLESLSIRHNRMLKLCGRFIELLDGAEGLLREAISGEPANAVEAIELEGRQTMRDVVNADIKENLAGVAQDEMTKFADIWGGTKQ